MSRPQPNIIVHLKLYSGRLKHFGKLWVGDGYPPPPWCSGPHKPNKISFSFPPLSLFFFFFFFSFLFFLGGEGGGKARPPHPPTPPNPPLPVRNTTLFYPVGHRLVLSGHRTTLFTRVDKCGCLIGWWQRDRPVYKRGNTIPRRISPARTCFNACAETPDPPT